MIDYSGPPPIIPTRTSVRTADRRRRSLPASSSNTSARRSANYVTVKPASPEVIRSLISTLSAISPPINQEVEYLHAASFSRSTPSSPLPYQTKYPLTTRSGGYVYKTDSVSPTRTGFGMEHDGCSKINDPRESFHLDSDHAPSLAVNRHSPERAPSSTTWSSYSSRSNLGRGYDLEGASNMGSLSIEPESRISATSTQSSQSGRQKRTMSFKGLKFKASSDEGYSESTRPFDAVTSSRSDGNIENCKAENEVYRLRLSNSSGLLDFEKSVTQDSTAESFQITSRPFSHNEPSSHVKSASKVPLASTRTTDSPHIIPNRESSLRHSFSGSPSHRRRKSYRSDPPGPQEPRKYSFECTRNSYPQEFQQASDDTVEDCVSRRIKELKDQKRLRDRPLTIATTSGLIIKAESRKSSHSPTPPTESSTLNESSREIQRPQDSLFEEESKIESPGSSAPAPAILQRVDRRSSGKVSPVASKKLGTKQALMKNSSEHERTDTVPPKRSNSRLLRRLSRPSSPTSGDKHKRTFSNPLFDERPKSTDPVDEAVNGYISSSRLSQKIKNPQTGRVISFSEVGDPNGSAVICCVGMGLTRFITAFYDELAMTLKLRLITPDRPGVGASEAHTDGLDTPLGWPDDLLSICQHLKLTRFSILAHSAGAIYALATALRMPQHIRGRIHILAPWIPPSQMAAIGTQQDALPVSSLPYSQRFLRSLPTPFLRAANSSFLSVTSASITTRLPKSPRPSKHKRLNVEAPNSGTAHNIDPYTSPTLPESRYNEASISKEAVISGTTSAARRRGDPRSHQVDGKERQTAYDVRLMEAIWSSATTDANPTVDLLVCLERRQSIGFRYVDITRAVVMHHGSKDTRVPVENVKWLGKNMRRCEVRVLEGEGHGLMASAAVMGGVLVEIAKEWEDWMRLVQRKDCTEKTAVKPSMSAMISS